MNTNSGTPDTPRRRGRPHKFGRPARLLALTLPDDVIAWLATLDPDPSRAIVGLFSQAGGNPVAPPAVARASGPEIGGIGNGRGLILVDPADVEGLPGVACVPFAAGRAFLALQPRQTIADLELAVIDALEGQELRERTKRASLARFRAMLRTWRKDPSLRFEERSIIVVERVRGRRGRGAREPVASA